MPTLGKRSKLVNMTSRHTLGGVTCFCFLCHACSFPAIHDPMWVYINTTWQQGMSFKEALSNVVREANELWTHGLSLEQRICDFISCISPTTPRPLALRTFDWVIAPGWRQLDLKSTPSSILVNPSKPFIDALLASIQTKKVSNAFLAFGTGDTHLSMLHQTVLNIKSSGQFRRILYESKDTEMHGVSTMPTGIMNIPYLIGRYSSFVDAVVKSDVKIKRALPLILGAWGAFHPNRRLKKHGLRAVLSRKEALKYAQRTSWINTSRVPKRHWFDILQQYKFLLCPAGNSLQNGKMIEALLVQTIPIVDYCPATREMRCMGYPLVLVRRWDEVTPTNLERWWRELSPCLDQFRWWLTALGWARIVHGHIPAAMLSICRLKEDVDWGCIM